MTFRSVRRAGRSAAWMFIPILFAATLGSTLLVAAAEAGLRSKGGRRGLSAAGKELKQVRRELMRKERALAETAALLVLRGKVDAFFSEGEEGDIDKRSGR